MMQEEFAGVVARAVTEPVEVWRGCLRVCWRRHVVYSSLWSIDVEHDRP